MAQIGDVVASNIEGVFYDKNSVGVVLKVCGDTGKMIVKFSSGLSPKIENCPQIVTTENFRIIPKGQTGFINTVPAKYNVAMEKRLTGRPTASL